MQQNLIDWKSEETYVLQIDIDIVWKNVQGKFKKSEKFHILTVMLVL